jgi:hypothetical protein
MSLTSVIEVLLMVIAIFMNMAHIHLDGKIEKEISTGLKFILELAQALKI